MPLVPAKCTQCGASLEVDSLKDAAVCPFCNTPFVTEKAINNYNITNISRIEKLQTENVIINDVTSIENRVRAGETFIKLGNFQAAQETFHELTQKCPFDYRGWWGLIRAKTEDFEGFMNHSSDFNEISDLYVNVSKTAEPDSLVEIGVLFDEYKKRWNEHFYVLTMEKTSELSHCVNEYNQKRKYIESNIEKINIKRKRIDDNHSMTGKIIAVIFAVVFLGLIIYGLIEASSVGNFILGMIIYGGIIGFIFHLIVDGVDSSHCSELASLDREQSNLDSQIRQLKFEYDEKRRKIEFKYSWL